MPDYRLHDFVVHMTDAMPTASSPPVAYSSGTQTCLTYAGVAGDAQVLELTCDHPVEGSVLVVQIPGDTECLVICEISVFGEELMEKYCKEKIEK